MTVRAMIAAALLLGGLGCPLPPHVPPEPFPDPISRQIAPDEAPALSPEGMRTACARDREAARDLLASTRVHTPDGWALVTHRRECERYQD